MDEMGEAAGTESKQLWVFKRLWMEQNGANQEALYFAFSIHNHP